jgi:enoyl-CoA hydratase
MEKKMAYKNILFDVDNAIATITFNRPKVLNALNKALLSELSDCLEAINADDQVRVLILTGAGEKSFVAGADIKELAAFNALEAKGFAESGQAVIGKLQQLPIPVIAAVNGFALGGGCEIALACDFIYASENAMFGLPEISLGLIPGFGGTQRLSRQIGKNMAKEMIFTGKMIPADQAQTIGLVNQVCESEDLIMTVHKTARTIAQKGRVCLRAAKQVINSGMDTDLGTGCRIEIDAFALCMVSRDAKEGTTAFIEKRKPEFKGSLKGF